MHSINHEPYYVTASYLPTDLNFFLKACIYRTWKLNTNCKQIVMDS